jgi:hypothetical protein
MVDVVVMVDIVVMVDVVVMENIDMVEIVVVVDIFVMVDIVVFKNTVPKYCNLLKLKVKKVQANLSQAYHWFILRMVMPLGVSCTVVIHVAYASCEIVRQ